MSSSLSGPTYLSVLRLPGAATTFAIGLVGRLAYGILTLPLLFTVQQRTGSIRTASLALAVYGVAALSAPLKSRLLDALGQPRVLTALGVLFPVPLVALSRLSHPAAGPVVLALAAVAGLLTPPLGPAMRYLWSRVAAEPAIKQRAYALDAIAEETLYTVGPAIAGGLVALGRAETALQATAVAALVGTLGLATSPLCRTYGSARPRRHTGGSPWGPLRILALWPLIGCIAAVGLAVGIVEISVAAHASAVGHPGSAGYVLAFLGLGSVAGATGWGRRQHGGRRTRQMASVMAVFAAGMLLAAVAPSLLWVAPAIFVAGLGLSPVLVVAFLASDDLVPEAYRTEATTWINTGHNLGWSGGSALAGSILVAGPTYAGFLVAAFVVGAAVGLIAGFRRVIDGP